ncbi:MAG TPA: DUF6600 domain-containing protein [Dissulfurispiraceae bacterium]
MKYLTMFCTICAMLLPLAISAADLGTAEISWVQGDVRIYTDEAGDWIPASLNLPLKEGDKIQVGENGRAELHIMGGLYIRFEGDTAFDILSLDRSGLHFYMGKGHTYLNNGPGGIRVVQIDTPLATFHSYDNSITMADVEDSGATGIGVLKGYVHVESRNGKTRVGANNYLRVDDGGYAELSPLGQPDLWEKWNLQRDRDLAGLRESVRYLPEELQEYSGDFDENGQWVYTRDYGYVWSPSSVVDDWAPYRVGRWVWIRNDYVWVSTERWGWAPYHYGRWTFIRGIGWCWTPPRPGNVYWAPGYVAWTYTSTYVSWVPLAPGDIYYGRGYYGPGSVNITVVNINKTGIKQEVRNVTINNAVTAIPMEAFARGAQVKERFRENLFAQHGVKAGPPPVKQEVKAIFPALKASPPAIRVPSMPETRKAPEEYREQRKFVRDAGSSAFSQRKPEPLPVKKLDEPKIIIRKHQNRLPEKPKTDSSRKEGHEKNEQKGKQDKGRKRKAEPLI